MNELIVIVLIVAIVACAIKWAESLKQERHEIAATVEQEGMIYMERIEKEREKRNHILQQGNHVV